MNQLREKFQLDLAEADKEAKKWFEIIKRLKKELVDKETELIQAEATYDAYMKTIKKTEELLKKL